MDIREASPKHPRRPAPSRKPDHPAAVATIQGGEEADLPFEEGAHDTLDPNLRHRMISEAAYHLYQQRGYAEGYELDDWLQAEAQVDHVAFNPERDNGPDAVAGEGELP